MVRLHEITTAAGNGQRRRLGVSSGIKRGGKNSPKNGGSPLIWKQRVKTSSSRSKTYSKPTTFQADFTTPEAAAGGSDT